MPALKHIKGPRVTVGEMSKRPPEERDGNSRPRGPGAGRPRKDGSTAVSTPQEFKHLRNRRGVVPSSSMKPPPSAEEQAAWLKRWAPDGELPDDKLTPMELWAETQKAILPFEAETALRICDCIENSQTIAWMVRNCSWFPGTRTWASWSTSDDIKQALKQRLEQRGLATQMAAQAAADRAPEMILSGKVPEKAAMAYAATIKTRAEVAMKTAAAFSPDRYGQQLNVRAESTIEHKHSVETKLLEELKQQLGIGTMKVIEGEVL